MRILVVDDDRDVQAVALRALAADGHQGIGAGSLAAARAVLADGDAVDLVVLDLRLPDGFGVDFCRELRDDEFRKPILLLTALTEVPTRVAGLDAGADDYLTKPFAVAELRARVRALGRRMPALRPSQAVLAGPSGAILLDFLARTATTEATLAPIPVTAREWAILEVLGAAAGRVVPRDALLEAVWGEATDANGASLEVLIGRLRRKLGATAVRTARGEGYAFSDPAPRRAETDAAADPAPRRAETDAAADPAPRRAETDAADPSERRAPRR